MKHGVSILYVIFCLLLLTKQSIDMEMNIIIFNSFSLSGTVALVFPGIQIKLSFVLGPPLSYHKLLAWNLLCVSEWLFLLFMTVYLRL